MGGIRAKVLRRSRVEHVVISVNYNQDSKGFDGLSSSVTSSPAVGYGDKKVEQPSWLPWIRDEISQGPSHADMNEGSACFPNQAAVSKISEVSSVLGKASSTGLGKAMEVLDMLGSGMSNWNFFGPTSPVPKKGNKISILAFEVASSICKGVSLMQSLSEDNIIHLKEVVLRSKGVQTLISRDMDELLRIAVADKREELETFFRDVVRFGNYSIDPEWRNLDRYFRKINSIVTQQKNFKNQAQRETKQLMTLVHSTAELCHELHLFDRMEKDYLNMLKEDSSDAARGHNLAVLRADIRNQGKLVYSLQKKSLWSKTFEEVVPKLVNIVHLLQLRIDEAFGRADDEPVESSQRKHKKLGHAGIALHYASIVTQISTLVSWSRSKVPQNMKDNLYQRLPSSIKSALRSKLQLVELTIPQIQNELEKTLEWLVPMASNTTKTLHSFGWLREWPNTEFEQSWKHGGQTGFLRIETLHHADKAKTEDCIFQLVIWLHHLINQTGATDGGLQSTPVTGRLLATHNSYCSSPILTVEDREMLQDASKNNLRLGMSKSQKYDAGKTNLSRQHRLSKSSPEYLAATKSSREYLAETNKTRKDPFPIGSLFSRPLDFDINRIKLLDVIDGVDTSKVK